MACLYIMVITITFRWDDLFRRFTLHLYIPFVPYSITQLLFIACEYTSYFGPPIIDIGRFSPLTLVTRYFRFVVAFQYRVFINSIMFITFLCIASPVKYRKLLCDRDLLRNFIFGHIVANALAGLSLFVVCREWSPTEDSAFIYTLSIVAFYFVQGANVTLSFLTFLSFVMAVVVMIVYRRKVAPNAVRANAVGNRKRLVTLVIYSTPPTIANMTSIGKPTAQNVRKTTVLATPNSSNDLHDSRIQTIPLDNSAVIDLQTNRKRGSQAEYHKYRCQNGTYPYSTVEN
ncbi:unnamed protein product [Toxocara canis]|uniref:Serpentine receptor class gamma n=1 Tax=Toxocara canis TaxID=6265 RepID=A0A183VDW8_TOXCA|nr:unnamed protein product [Toxocara canis]